MTENLTQQELLKKFYLRYPVLRPSKKIEPHVYQQALDSFKNNDLDFSKPTLFVCPQDLSKFCFSMALSKIQYAYSFEFLSLGQLLDIWLSSDSPYPSFNDVNTNIVSLYWGYGDLLNRESSKVIENAVSVSHQKGSLRRVTKWGVTEIKGQTMWLYYRGTNTDLEKNYPTLNPHLKALGYQFFNLQSGLSSQSFSSGKTLSAPVPSNIF